MSANVPLDGSVLPQERFLLDRIDYERTQSMPCSEEAFKLDRMRELLRRLGDPQKSLPIVHIAGTKGKGSTAAMMAAVLSAAGYRTGLFTSPHLDRVEERMMVDGLACSAEELAGLIDLIRPAVEAMDRAAAAANPPEHGPTYFEIITAAALCHFVRCRATAAVLEVGLGGRLDSTNVCTPCLSIITSISFDHTKQLGNTLAAIAAEKAGIIKPGVPVISGVTTEEPRDVVREVARQKGSRLVELGVDFDFDYRPPQHLEQGPQPAHFDFRQLDPGCESPLPHEFPLSKENSRELTAPGDVGTKDATFRGLLAPGYCDEAAIGFDDLALGLIGRHQASNAALVVAAVEELRRTGWNISEAALRRGLADVCWPARVEVIARRPTVVLDAAHNAASIAALVDVLAESFSARRRLLVFATTREKDLRGMLKCLHGRFDHVIFTRYLNNPRSVPPEELQACFSSLPKGEGKAVSVEIAPTPSEAWDAIHRMAGIDDLICITGSFFIAAEMRREVVGRPLGGGD